MRPEVGRAVPIDALAHHDYAYSGRRGNLADPALANCMRCWKAKIRFFSITRVSVCRVVKDAILSACRAQLLVVRACTARFVHGTLPLAL